MHVSLVSRSTAQLFLHIVKKAGRELGRLCYVNCVGLRDVGCVALLNQIVLLRSNICVQGEEASSTKPARHLEFARISESRDLMRKKNPKGQTRK